MDKLNIDLRIRDVKPVDINDIFEWRNHLEIRKNFFDAKPVSWDKHKQWFKRKIKEPNTTIYIAYCAEEKIGSIRFDCEDKVIKVSIMLNPSFLGRGLGSKLIRIGTERFLTVEKTDRPLIAEIKKDNIASIKAFQKAGFRESHLTYIFNDKKSSLSKPG